MSETVALIEKYKARLDPQYELKKIYRALQKLNEIDMTVTLLRDTGVGRAVHKLRKEKGLGEFAREIVTKWKKISNTGDQTRSDAVASRIKREPVEYDPASNWNTSTLNNNSTSYRPARSVKRETIDEDEDEYDPSQNWQLEGVKSEPDVPAYDPSSSPVRIKKEISPKLKKKHREKEHGTPKKALENQQKIRHRPVKTKVQEKRHRPVAKATPISRYELGGAPSDNEIEEYDPSDNFELSNNSSEAYDPESDQENYEEYQTGLYRISHQLNVTLGNQSDEENDYDQPSMAQSSQSHEGSDSEGSDEGDEPGNYLLHPHKARKDTSHHSSQDSETEPTPDSFVQATTLYSRNKSVDSEDGMWGSRVNIGRENTEMNNSSKKSSKTKNLVIEKSNSVTKSEKPKKMKIKTENSADTSKSSKIGRDSKKRKSGENSKYEPTKKKSKPVKGERSEVREANFLFENIPDIAKPSKRKHKTKPSSKQSSIKNTEPKLNLHLPKIQATYRPLPQVETNSFKHKEVALTDNEAAELHSKRQTKKMLVYSGGGGGFIPKMMSLFDQCMTVLMNNIDAIESFGPIPFDIVQPILIKCTPDQLYRLEDFNPYLLEDTDPLWKEHCSNEFRSKIPDEMESWREMFLRLSDERERKLASLTHMISMKEAKKKPLEKKAMLAYVGANAKPPRSVRRAQEKYGTAGRSRPSSSVMSQSTSAMRNHLVESRMAVPVGSITAATVDRVNRSQQISQIKKPRIAPMMAKTLKSISKTRYRR